MELTQLLLLFHGTPRAPISLTLSPSCFLSLTSVALFAAAAVAALVLTGGAAEAATMAIYNRCSHPVWPGIQPSAGKPILARGGFGLLPNQAYTLRLPAGWSGRLWGRQDCAFDGAGRGRCATGDCGAGLYCEGAGGAPPATLAEITLGGEQDFYDVSLVDGYNLGMALAPRPERRVPGGLAVKSGKDGRVVGCKSACYAFRSDRFCCTGSFGGPQQCKPTAYSRLFKEACPRAYSYAYDDPTSIITCSAASYVLTFCPRS
ncbi:unnamed protein product [Spirodela intermedia]|uniref:Uncharacterized protein n=1 Tax=Spirodela intermedia TaxID=51605 RepID=A0A7I8J4L2_SPIIN|nr:unnamed protein product [Spirodela intermedia]CAA6664311.1 unnamed protein product [Spirodela intermedia]